VFGIPAASMFSTDRYSFLKKIRFGRKTRVYRVLGIQYETDSKEHKFVQTFELERGEDIDDTVLKCLFLPEPAANAKSLSDADLGKIAKSLKLDFVPPALERRSEETGISPKQYVMEAFLKGKFYSQAFEASEKYKHAQFLELDFVLKCTTAMNSMLKRVHGEGIDWAKVDKEWAKTFADLMKRELAEASADAEATGEKQPKKA
jgi:hypothetical protein